MTDIQKLLAVLHFYNDTNVAEQLTSLARTLRRYYCGYRICIYLDSDGTLLFSRSSCCDNFYCYRESLFLVMQFKPDKKLDRNYLFHLLKNSLYKSIKEIEENLQ